MNESKARVCINILNDYALTQNVLLDAIAICPYKKTLYLQMVDVYDQLKEFEKALAYLVL